MRSCEARENQRKRRNEIKPRNHWILIILPSLYDFDGQRRAEIGHQWPGKTKKKRRLIEQGIVSYQIDWPGLQQQQQQKKNNGDQARVRWTKLIERPRRATAFH